MKTRSLLLMIVFGAVLLAQGACAMGLRVHDHCPAAPIHHDVGDTCGWDPCRQDFAAATEKQRVETPLAPAGVSGAPVVQVVPTPVSRPAQRVARPGATPPRPAGLYPLLI